MFQDGTTYQFATQNYSAPEVTVHSENATERSDIYSLGAVIYFLFTGEVPVTATEMPTAIQSAGGIDVKLKEVLLKMCAPAPADRYENIDDCELALAPLYQRYCGSDERYFFAVPTNALDDLKRRNLVRRDMPYLELLDSFLPAQFAGGLIRLRAEGQTSIYCFDGISISMECVLSDDFSRWSLSAGWMPSSGSSTSAFPWRFLGIFNFCFRTESQTPLFPTIAARS